MIKAEKIKIKNRKGQNIAVLIEKNDNAKGIAFIVHGMSGHKEQPHIKIFAESFLESGFTVVRYDSTHALGESDGNLEDITATQNYNDLEDVIKWSEKQAWYLEPFWLVGHSLGSFSIALYAENFPERIKALAPISTLVSGKLSEQTYSKKELNNWKKTGLLKYIGSKGKEKRIKWAYMESKLKYDLLPEVHKFKMPVLLIVGESDDSTPVEHQKILFDALPDKKELHIIKGAMHTFREKEHLDEIKGIFLNWIKSVK